MRVTVVSIILTQDRFIVLQFLIFISLPMYLDIGNMNGWSFFYFIIRKDEYIVEKIHQCTNEFERDSSYVVLSC